MFCDHCDRGYHTFCVGLKSIPEGRWECPTCQDIVIPPKPKYTEYSYLKQKPFGLVFW